LRKRETHLERSLDVDTDKARLAQVNADRFTTVGLIRSAISQATLWMQGISGAGQVAGVARA